MVMLLRSKNVIRVASQTRPILAIGLTLASLFAVYCAVYLVTPRDLSWHLNYLASTALCTDVAELPIPHVLKYWKSRKNVSVPAQKVTLDATSENRKCVFALISNGRGSFSKQRTCGIRGEPTISAVIMQLF